MPKPKLDDDRVEVVKSTSLLVAEAGGELKKNIDAIMESQASLAKAVASINTEILEIKKLAKAGRF